MINKQKNITDKKSFPIISVIVPIYMSEKYLKRCLESLFVQTFTDFEAICINDGSPDACSTILNECAQKDSRIKIITQTNQGLSAARNNGLQKACGKFICFLDPDDCLHPQFLEITYWFAIKYNADWVIGGFKKFFLVSDEQIIMPKSKNYSDFKYMAFSSPTDPFLRFLDGKKAKFKIHVAVWGKLYKRELLKNIFFMLNIYWEDVPYTCSILIKHPKTLILKHQLYYYTNNPSSICNKTITERGIKDYHAVLLFIYNHTNNLSAKHIKKSKNCVFKICCVLIKKIRQVPLVQQTRLYEAFTKILTDLSDKNWIEMGTITPNRIKWLWRFKNLIKKYKKGKIK